MKILFIVQGEGRGHLTQALSLSKKLRDQGDEVVGVMVGKSPSRRLPAFFTDHIGAPLYLFDSPNFLPSSRNKRANLTKSLLYNLLRLPIYAKSIYQIQHRIKETEADVVVNFYELLTGLTYLFFQPKAQMICIAHQYLFLHPDYEFPKVNKLSLLSLCFFTWMTSIRCTKRLALSLHKMRDVYSRRLIVVPPLLREEVLQTKPETGDYLHGYMLNSGYSEEIYSWHRSHPQVKLKIFWDKSDVTPEVKVDAHLSFYQLNDKLFIRSMASSKAFATTAGFESVSEAMYLGKPVLMVPTHIEQECNAYDAAKTGAGTISDRFDLDRLLDLSKNYEPNPTFVNWVKQADWLILREFRPDILMDEENISFWQHISTQWLYRLMRSI